MNVGLLTFTSNNYGTCLQAYAIKRAIEATGHQVTFLNQLNRKAQSRAFQEQKFAKRITLFIRRLSIRRILTRLIYGKLRDEINSSRVYKFHDFISTYILTNKIEFNSIRDLETQASFSFDAVVCGSDMIWSSEFSTYFDIYQLAWCRKGRKISYAPSLGCIDFSEKEKLTCAKNLSSFDCLSCRENSGVSFLSKLLNREIKEVLDPTLLFEGNDWLSFFSIKKSVVKNPYILVYCFGGISNRRKREIEKRAKRDKLAVRYILSPEIMDTVNEKKYGDGSYGPIEYVRLFSEAAFTVVNGYHGLLFSLIFEKPFVVLHRDKGEHWGTHENRMAEVLSKYSLSERYLHDTDPINRSLYSLDYHNINQILSKEREDGWKYLKDSLSLT